MLDPRELPELPEIADSSLETIRLKGTLSRRLPSMPSGDLQDLHFTNSRQLEAEKFANDIRASYAISRQYDMRSRARARARNRQSQRAAERR